MPEARRDLVERSLAFSTRLLRFVQLLRRSTQVEPSVLYQLVRAGSAIGAHNAEAESAISRRQLLTLRAGALREAREAQYWLTLLLDTTDRPPDAESAWLLQEVSELVAILTTVVKRLGGTAAPKPDSSRTS